MDFIINKNQLQFLVESEEKSRLSENMREMYSFIAKMANRIEKKYGINIKMLMTWGPAVAGLVMPLDNFLRNSEFSLTEEQIYLVVASAVFFIFFEKRKTTSKLKKEIEDQGLEEPLNTSINKLTQLRDSFANFLNSSGVVLNNLSDVISYSFLIPIIQDIQNMVVNSSSFDDGVMMIVKRLIVSGLIMISGEVLQESMRKIANKFR